MAQEPQKPQERLERQHLAMHTYALEQLQRVLEEMQGLGQLPPAKSPEALADHEGWMKRFDHIVEVYRRAMYIACLVLPSDVDAKLREIEKLKYHLLNLPPLPTCLEKTTDVSR